MRTAVILIAAVLVAVLAVFGFIGYVLNIVALVTAEATMTLVEVAIRIVGIFVPFVGTLSGFLL